MKQISIDINHRLENKMNGHSEYSLDEAIEAAKIGKYQTILILLTGLSILGSVIENMNISYIVPYAKCDLGFTTEQQGILGSVSFLGIVSTSYFWGFLTDTTGRKKVISYAAFGGFFFSFLSAFAMDFYSLVLFRYLTGAMLAGSQTASYSYVSEFHTKRLAPRAVAFATVCMNALPSILSVLAILIIPMDWSWHIVSTLDFTPWRLFLICNSLINLFCGVVFSILPETPKFLLTINKMDKALDVLKRVYAFNTGQPEDNYPVKRIKSDETGNKLSDTHGFCKIIQLMWSQTKPIFLSPLRTHTWKVCYVTFVIFSVGHGVFIWFPDFLIQLQNHNGPSNTLCAIIQPKLKSFHVQNECDNLDNKNLLSYEILFGSGIFLLTAAVMGSMLMKKISSKIILSAWLLMSAIASFALVFFTEFYLIVISFIVFLNIISGIAITMALGVNLFPTKYRGLATAFVMLFGRVGSFTGGTVIGILLTNNCSLIFYICGAMLISCIFVVFAINTNDTTNEQQSSTTISDTAAET